MKMHIKFDVKHIQSYIQMNIYIDIQLKRKRGEIFAKYSLSKQHIETIDGMLGTFN